MVSFDCFSIDEKCRRTLDLAHPPRFIGHGKDGGLRCLVSEARVECRRWHAAFGHKRCQATRARQRFQPGDGILGRGRSIELCRAVEQLRLGSKYRFVISEKTGGRSAACCKCCGMASR